MGRKLYLILDNLRVHHCAPVKAWIEERHMQIAVHHLLTYSPELSPDEHLNRSLRSKLGHYGRPLVFNFGVGGQSMLFVAMVVLRSRILCVLPPRSVVKVPFQPSSLQGPLSHFTVLVEASNSYVPSP